MSIKVIKYSNLGNEIKNAIYEQKRIEVIIYNTKQDFASIDYLKKLIKIDKNIDKKKTWAKIELYLNDIVENLHSIEKLILKYSELWQGEFDSLKNKLHKELNKLPLIPNEYSLIK